ncbi:TolC family protein [Sphingobacterium sp. HJSM2_6]|uniref:TolC family protein n=1 Tax=Sphingobacterium sp. HJSM2_6 TaxID=3366264 RepID=UPI003BC489CE
MKFEISKFSCIFLIFITTSVCAQTKLSLKDCFRLIEEQNYDVMQSNFKILLSELDLKDAKNSFLPIINFGAGNNYNLGLAFDQISGELVTGNKWSNIVNANINMRFPIFQNYSFRNRLKQSLLSLEVNNLLKEQVLQILQIQLLTNYVEAAANKSLYEISLKQLDFAIKQLNQEKQKFEIGTNSIIDITQAESTVASNEFVILNNLINYKNNILDIKQIIGIPLSDSIILQDIDTTDIEKVFFLYESDNFKDPFIRKSKLEIKQSELNLKYAKGAYFPSISFFGGYGTNYSSERKDFLTGNYMPLINQINQNRNLNFGLSLSVPIFDAFKTRNNIVKLKFDLNSKHSELKNIKIERQKLIILAEQEYQRSIKEHAFKLMQKSAQEKNLSAVKERYEIGVANAIEYNKAILDFNLSEENLIKCKYTIILNLETLKILSNTSSL